MAFPQVQAFIEQAFSSGTSHNVNMPATVASGELLCMPVAAYGGTNTTISTPTGWTQLYNFQELSFVTSAVFVKVADGTEGGTTVDVQTNVSRAVATQVYRISSFAGTLSDVEQGTVSAGSGSSFDPPAVTASWGAEDNLFIVVAALGDDDVAITGFPANYTNGDHIVSGGGGNNGCTIGSARRELAAASDDPGTMTSASSESWITNTLVIRPAAATGQIIERTVTDRILIPDEDERNQDHTQREGLFLFDLVSKIREHSQRNGLFLNDNTLASVLNQILSSDGVFLNDKLLKIQEATQREGTLLDDRTIKDQLKLLQEGLLLNDSSVVEIFTALAERLITDRLLIDDSTTRIIERVLRNNLLLSDSVVVEAIAGFVTDLVLRDGLFLQDQLLKIQEAINPDSMLVDDRIIKLRESAVRDGLFMQDQTILTRIFQKFLIDGVFVNDQLLMERQLISADSLLIKSERRSSLQRIIREELLVSDSVIATIIDILAEALVFALVSTRDIMGITISNRDVMSIKVSHKVPGVN